MTTKPTGQNTNSRQYWQEDPNLPASPSTQAPVAPALAEPASPPTFTTINKSQLIYQNQLGEGYFGLVYKGQWSRHPVAIKTIKPPTTPQGRDALKELIEEAQLVSRLTHPHIVRLYGVVQDSDTPAMVFEYLSGGSLDNYLYQSTPIDWNIRYGLSYDVALGLAYLHSKSVIHRDIKSPNVLLTDQLRAKISDFGISKERHETKTVTASDKAIGSTCWMGPELFDPEAKYSKRSDIYSLSILFWEIAAQQKPWAGISAARVGVGVSMGHRPKIPEGTPAPYTALMQSCWDQDQQKRPTAQAVVDTLEALNGQLHFNVDIPTGPVQVEPERVVPLQQFAEATKAQRAAEELLRETNERSARLEQELARQKLENQKAQAELRRQLEEERKSAVKAPSPPAVVAAQPSARVERPALAFGAKEWKEYIGDVGVEPPLPADISKILESPCPYWPGKKVWETHLLTLVPETVNGKPLNLKLLGELIQKPLKGNSTKYRGFSLGEYTDPAAPKSHWALMTKTVIEGSRKKSYTEQQKLIKAPYEVPKLLDAAVAILMEYVKSGTRLYNDSPWTYTRCQEAYNKQNGWQLVVGGFSSGGLDARYYPYARETLGIGSLRRF